MNIADYCTYAHYVADMEGIIFRAVDSALTKEVNATLNAIIDGVTPGETKTEVKVAPSNNHGSSSSGFSSSSGSSHPPAPSVHSGAPVIRISQAVQFSINAAYFADAACAYLERYIVSASDSKASSHESQLAARKAFGNTRGRCEDLLFELVDAKIDSFMSLAANINWLPTVCQTTANDFISGEHRFLWVWERTMLVGYMVV